MTKDNKPKSAFDANAVYKEADEANKKNTAKDINEAREQQKQAKDKPQAEFVKKTEEDEKEIQNLLNSKKQNLVQALKNYYQQVFIVKQAVLFQERFEKAIKDGTEIKDDYGLPFSEEELKLEAQKMYIDLKFRKAQLIWQRDEFKKVWDYDDAKIEKKFQEWFVENKDMEV